MVEEQHSNTSFTRKTAAPASYQQRTRAHFVVGGDHLRVRIRFPSLNCQAWLLHRPFGDDELLLKHYFEVTEFTRKYGAYLRKHDCTFLVSKA